MQVWLYATPIMYPLSIVAEAKPGLVPLYRANPMERFTEVFRNTIYDGRWPSLADTVFVVVVSLVVARSSATWSSSATKVGWRRSCDRG